MNATHEVAGVCDGQAARALLGANPQPGLIRAMACRADELGFDDPAKALEVAATAQRVALSSLGVMSALRYESEALRAIQALHRAARALSIDRATVRSVRRVLVASRP